MITRSQFAEQTLLQVGIAPTYNVVDALVAWMSMENTLAFNNPLSTERIMNMSETDFNSAGVKNYPSVQIGLEATGDTLKNGYYGPLLTAMTTDNYANVVNAVDSSPWGTRGVAGVVTSADLWNHPIASQDELPPCSFTFGEVPATPAPAPVPTPPPSISYTIQPGDNIWSIAQKYLNAQSLPLVEFVNAIVSGNLALLDQVAQHRGRPNSNNGSLIFPGTIINIPL